MLPRWLVLLLVGIALGAGGVVLVQEHYLAPRLSADESVALRKSFEQADAERLRLKGELTNATKGLETALAEKKALADEFAGSRDTIARLLAEVDSLVAVLPSDPRGGAIEVRAARFGVKGRTLAYEVVLSRESGNSKALAGVMQFTVAGDAGRGKESSITLAPVAVSIGKYVISRGSLPLPEGFSPRQSTINVLDRVDGKSLGMRVMNVK